MFPSEVSTRLVPALSVLVYYMCRYVGYLNPSNKISHLYSTPHRNGSQMFLFNPHPSLWGMLLGNGLQSHAVPHPGQISFIVVTCSCRECSLHPKLAVGQKMNQCQFSGFPPVWVVQLLLLCFMLKTCTMPIFWSSNEALTHLNSSKIQTLIRFQLLKSLTWLRVKR